MAAGDINDALTNIPNVVLVDQADASAAPGAGYGRLEVVDGVLGVRVGTGAWVALVSLVAGLLTSLTEKATPADTDLLLLQDEAAASALKKVQIGNLPGGATGYLFDAYINVQDQKAQNTAGGTFTQDAWRTRDLNTEQADTASIATLASNQVTLPAGTYVCHASAPAHRCGMHQSRLYDTTGAAVLLTGTPEYLPDLSSTPPGRSIIRGLFTIGGESDLELQHYCGETYADFGFGVAANITTEVYSILEFWRVAA